MNKFLIKNLSYGFTKEYFSPVNKPEVFFCQSGSKCAED